METLNTINTSYLLELSFSGLYFLFGLDHCHRWQTAWSNVVFCWDFSQHYLVWQAVNSEDLLTGGYTFEDVVLPLPG